MKNLLARESDYVLESLARLRVLLAFDFDGTLAPIVADREAAQMREETSTLLEEVCRLYPCAVISGRARKDVAARLGRAGVQYVVGNHGLEPNACFDEFEREITVARPLLEAALASTRGIDVEDKRYSLAVHYRGAARTRLARQAIEAALAELPMHLRVVPGKQVLNLVPERAPNKGQALLHLLQEAGADVALYVGDDVTDEDVFRLGDPKRLVGVRVSESMRSAAPYYVEDQKSVDRLLARLVRLRDNSQGP